MKIEQSLGVKITNLGNTSEFVNTAIKSISRQTSLARNLVLKRKALEIFYREGDILKLFIDKIEKKMTCLPITY